MRVAQVVAAGIGVVLLTLGTSALLRPERVAAQDVGAQFIGEIRMFAGIEAPSGWALCNGAELQIVDNQDLFSVIGSTFGGNGRATFALPDLRGRMPLGAGSPREVQFPALGGMAGAEEVTLTVDQLPPHSHALAASGQLQKKNRDRLRDPTGAWLAHGKARNYTTRQADAELGAGSVAATGGGLPHDNMPPFTAVNFIIAIDGVLPGPGGR